jgi:hypothetical protein
VPRIQQRLDEVWSSTTVGAPAILFLRYFRRRSFAAIGVVHGSPSANAAQYAGYRRGGQCPKLSSEYCSNDLVGTRQELKIVIFSPCRGRALASYKGMISAADECRPICGRGTDGRGLRRRVCGSSKFADALSKGVAQEIRARDQAARARERVKLRHACSNGQYEIRNRPARLCSRRGSISRAGSRTGLQRLVYSPLAVTFLAGGSKDFAARFCRLLDLLGPRAITGGADDFGHFMRLFHSDQS